MSGQVAKTAMPERVHTVFCEWELIGCIFPLGAEFRDTKTFVHRRGSRYALTRYLHGHLIGHIVITQAEFEALRGLI